MRNHSSAFRARILGQAAVVAILAGSAAACSSDASRLREPFITGSTANQQQIIGNNGDQPMPAPINGGAVTSSNLPPPPGALASTQPMPMGTAPEMSPAGWSAAGGSVVTVGPGESLDSLAIRYGVPSVEIARANRISSPAEIQAGKVIVIPVRVAQAAPAEVPVAAAPKAAKFGGTVHVVENGETLYGIARRSGTRVNDIVAVNGLSSESLRVGQKLKIPAGGVAIPQAVAYAEEKPKVLGAPPKPLGQLVVKAPQPGEPAVPAAPEPAVAIVPQGPAVSEEPVAAPQAPAETVALDPTADPASANGTSFRWPVRGRIIASFGSKPNGERNDGINLAVPEGTSVKAAEAGTVIYSGNELAGYGNLVLIRHADGWVSAYAHNSQIMVKRGDAVKRGQTVATAGMTGSVTAPQVHFELRKGAKPVNPMDYLAGV